MDVLLDAFLDTAKILPFLFITYLAMEYLEHKTEDKSAAFLRRSGRMGPVIGGILGIFPQCGFSAAAASFFSGGVITTGTLIAVFLSTSDEMLPIFISRAVPAGIIMKVLAAKLILGILTGLAVDLGLRLTSAANPQNLGSYIRYQKQSGGNAKHQQSGKNAKHQQSGGNAKHQQSGKSAKHQQNSRNAKHQRNSGNARLEEKSIHDLCERDQCGCDDNSPHGIILPALRHTVKIIVFIFLLSVIIGFAVEMLGEEALASFMAEKSILGVFLTALVGLIPNCAASVMITELYLEGILEAGQMLAGLLVSAGVGLLVLFRTNRQMRENLIVTGILYGSSVFWGLLFSILQISF